MDVFVIQGYINPERLRDPVPCNVIYFVMVSTAINGLFLFSFNIYLNVSIKIFFIGLDLRTFIYNITVNVDFENFSYMMDP